MYRKLTLAFASILCSLALFAQTQSGGVKGTIVGRVGQEPVAKADVRLLSKGVELARAISDAQGAFIIEGLEDGSYAVEVTAPGYRKSFVNVVVEGGFVKDMRNLSLVPDRKIEVLDEAKELGIQEESGAEEMDYSDLGVNDSPSMVFNSYDVYSNITGFGFSSVRFKNRGYNSESQDVYFSGVKMNDAITGYSPFSLWSGLNEATRAKETSIGAEAADYGVGGYNSITNVYGDPLSMRPGFRFSFLSNSALYRMRFMASYATGRLDNGWSFAANVSARLGGNDWVKGVFYRSFAYYVAAEKAFNDQHKLALMIFGTPGQRGAQNASTQEVYDLMGDNMYNSNWGWQDGKMRNARVRKTHEPVFVLKYTANPRENLETELTFLYRTGKNGYTALDWYDAPDPRPDYYRNLPSYFYNENPDYNRSNPMKYNWAKEMWNPDIDEYENYRHINWDRLYNINYNSDNGRSKYVIEERRVDQNDLNLNFATRWDINEFMKLSGGVAFKYNTTHNYKKIDDLLGGLYYENIDQFAERDFRDPIKIQNDLDYYLATGHAQQLKKGDIYGYNYVANVIDTKVWANYQYQRHGWDAAIAAEIGYNGFWRDGLYRKGLFPENSKGKSEMSNFLTARVKGHLGYDFKGGHQLYANVGFFNDAPKFSKSFVSPRTRNTLAPNLTTSKTFTADVNYHWKHDDWDIRLTGFWTKIMDQNNLISFYDDTQHSFTNFAMSGLDQRHMGIELGFQIPLYIKGLVLQGALSLGEYIYTSNPYMTQTIDNSEQLIINNQELPYWKSHPIYKLVQTEAPANGNVPAHGSHEYMKDKDGNYIVEKEQKHYVPSTPQLAASIGLKYNTSSYWFFEVNGQYFGNSYLDMNPLYRTEFAVAGPDGVITPEEMAYMPAQEKFDPVFLLNASIGKSWFIKYKYNFGFSIQVNNITNNRCVKTGGYEQTRLIKGVTTNPDNNLPARYYKFDPKYFYMQGTNYMLNLYFRF